MRGEVLGYLEISEPASGLRSHLCRIVLCRVKRPLGERGSSRSDLRRDERAPREAMEWGGDDEGHVVFGHSVSQMSHNHRYVASPSSRAPEPFALVRAHGAIGRYQLVHRMSEFDPHSDKPSGGETTRILVMSSITRRHGKPPSTFFRTTLMRLSVPFSNEMD